MDLQRLLSLTRKAMDDYQMIQEGDKIAVGKRLSHSFICNGKFEAVLSEKIFPDRNYGRPRL